MERNNGQENLLYNILKIEFQIQVSSTISYIDIEYKLVTL